MNNQVANHEETEPQVDVDHEAVVPTESLMPLSTAVARFNEIIDTCSETELETMIESLKKAKCDRVSKAKSHAMNEIKRIAEQAGIDVAVVPQKTETRGAKLGSKAKIKYLNAATGESWTGRGIAPKWVQAIKNDTNDDLNNYLV